MSANDTARTPEPFVYRLKAVAKVMGGDTVVGGDTVDLDLDLGFSINLRQRCVSMASTPLKCTPRTRSRRPKAWRAPIYLLSGTASWLKEY